ncbi:MULTISPECIES: hypothetical protein [unclassified Vibrio]|uniref:hypothetical protein n=1 Tax=unclassified Vibrio TaxID=2614977 RepID=UPI0018D3FF4C|nr:MULTISPECIES: hypothetical protein [unclassified Vibrio]
MNIKPIQFIILGVIVGFCMNGLYDVAHDDQHSSNQMANQGQVTFSNCTNNAKDS